MCCSICGAIGQAETMLMLPPGVQTNCWGLTIHVEGTTTTSRLCCCLPRKPCAHVVRKEAAASLARAKDIEEEETEKLARREEAIMGSAPRERNPAKSRAKAVAHRKIRARLAKNRIFKFSQQTGCRYYRLVAPKVKEGIVLIFPSDGSQPTTEDAEIFAHADADSLKNTDITEFYLQLFGKGGGGAVISAGWSEKRQRNVPIICFARGGTEETRALFWTTFEKIASTRTGRLLLYRLLIEIWRVEKPGAQRTAVFSKGSEEAAGPRSKPVSPTDASARNAARGLCVTAGSAPFYMRVSVAPEAPKEAGLSFPKKDRRFSYTTAGPALKWPSTCPIFSVASSLSPTLLHELLHWFHQLRCFVRHAREASGLKVDEESSSDDPCCGLTNAASPLVAYYWEELLGRSGAAGVLSSRISALPWINGDVPIPYLKIEEMRTILGAPRAGRLKAAAQTNKAAQELLESFKEGDDLSENLYRTELGESIRFGHSDFLFWEDVRVLARVRAACGGSLSREAPPQAGTIPGLGEFLVPLTGGHQAVLDSINATYPLPAA